MITTEQIRAARILLDWNQEQLASAAGIGSATLKRMEARSGLARGQADTVWKIQAALQEAGVIFIPSDAQHGYGVRLAKSSAT